MLIVALPVLDAGSFGKSSGAGVDSEARERPEHSAGAAAAENHRLAEWPANWYV